MGNSISTFKTRSGRIIEVINLASDPNMWVVNTYKKFLFCKSKVSSIWFNDKDQATAYAKKLKEADGNINSLPEYKLTTEFRHYKAKA